MEDTGEKMNSDFITEQDWIKLPEEQRELFMFRMVTETRHDVKELKRQKFVFHSGCSLLGGVIGGFLASIGIKVGKIPGALQ